MAARRELPACHDDCGSPVVWQQSARQVTGARNSREAAQHSQRVHGNEKERAWLREAKACVVVGRGEVCEGVRWGRLS